MHSILTYLPALLAFGITVALCPVFIPLLHKLKFGQYVRDDGPQTHLKKAGTPTMGGIVMIAAFAIVSAIYCLREPVMLPVMLLTIGFGFIGFLDDFIKITKKRSLGLRAWQKLALQFLVTALFIYLIQKYFDYGTAIVIPFTGGKTFSMSEGLFVIFSFIAILGTVNGVNFTDGLDGLASSVTLVIAVFFAFASLADTGEPNGVTTVSLITIGVLCGFLIFNAYPAKVFMGDTGSLALGGYVAGAAFMLRMPLFIIIVAFIYLIEIVSVILQVLYFKATHGKRLFKMAPIHHHFELSGWEETRVVALFTVVTIMLALVGLAGM